MERVARIGRLLAMASDYTPQEVAELWADGTIQLIDVRERHEHEAGRIAGTRLIELGSLQQEAGTIDPKQPVVFYCRSGGALGDGDRGVRAGGLRCAQHDGRDARVGRRGAPDRARRRLRRRPLSVGRPRLVAGSQ